MPCCPNSKCDVINDESDVIKGRVFKPPSNSSLIAEDSWVLCKVAFVLISYKIDKYKWKCYVQYMQFNGYDNLLGTELLYV